MASTMGREADVVALFGALATAPYRYDFYQTLRRLECLFDDKPRVGRAARPAEEAVRFGQNPDLAFAPASLAGFETGHEGRPARLQVALFGLLGPNGPLPLHLTEYARERERHAGDHTLSRFFDLFNHRLITFFYRAWAQAQPHVNRDRPGDDRFATYIGAFAGLSQPVFKDRDAVPDLAKFFHIGALMRQSRNPEGLAAILRTFFGVSVTIQEFVGHWLALDESERTRLGQTGATLGSGAVAGARVWDRQNKFQIRLGPLTLAQYESFLPSGSMLQKLAHWVRLYLCFELDWDVRLVLKSSEVPPLKLGAGRLGWTTWLGQRPAKDDAADLCLVPESFVAAVGAAAA